jgi:ABC-2 type transport system ATP-binding protein
MAAATSRITARGLTMDYGGFRAVHDIDLDVAPGQVTGFMGPNGSGKSTTLRLLLGIQTPTSGWATVNGKNCRELEQPLRTVGAALEGNAFVRSRTARSHLRCWSGMAGASTQRVDELLGLVKLEDAADRRIGNFSLGMKQRLALATALLGDPEVLILDEPANGLDPDGILWLRNLLRDFAAEGRTILVSSHLLAEMERIVDHVLLIRSGELLYSGTVPGLLDGGSSDVATAGHRDLEEAYFSLTDVR